MGLPLHRIRESPPASADRDGHKLMKNYGMKFIHFIESHQCDGPKITNYGSPNYDQALCQFFYPKLSNDTNRELLGKDLYDRYRLNEMRWEGFWITEEEFKRACCDAVADFSLARAWGVKM